MKTTPSSQEIRPFEKVLLRIDTPPWDAIYRAAIGCTAVPAMSLFWSNNRSGWVLAPFLLGILLILRVIPAVIRMVVPFSSTVQEIWAKRRQIGKRYDSYQWQKLLWIGTGLALYMEISGHFPTSVIVASSFCLVSGGLGFARWRAIASRTDMTGEPTPHAHVMG